MGLQNKNAMVKKPLKRGARVKRDPKKWITLAGLLIVLVIIVAFATHHSTKTATPTQTVTTADGSKVNLSPPTAAEKQASDNAKSAIIQKDEQQSSSSSGSSQASVVITEVNASGAKAYISNVFENGGTCTFTASQGSQTITKTSTGFENVSYTQCPPVTWALGSGSWTITVNYTSGTSQGSQTTTLKV